MRSSVLFPSLVLGATVVSTVPTLAQTAGQWDGTLELEGIGRLAVQFLASEDQGTLSASMKTSDGPPSAVTDLRWSEEVLAFTWGAFQCTLQSRSHAYEGDCVVQGENSKAQLKLEPANVEISNEVADEPEGDVLTTRDMLATQARNVYDAIDALRPRWLVVRGPAKYNRTIYVYVYLDGQRMGDVAYLRSLAIDAIQDARYYNASDATFLFGRANEGGAIALRRRHE